MAPVAGRVNLSSVNLVGVVNENTQDCTPEALARRVARVPYVFARNCRYRRVVLGMSQEEVARQLRGLGVPWHQTVLAKVESGERAVKLAEAYALASIYGLWVDDLMYGQHLDQVGVMKVDFPFADGTPRVIRDTAPLGRDKLERAESAGLYPETP